MSHNTYGIECTFD